MGEETGQVETEVEAEAEATTTPTPIIGEDGKFVTNWQETLPEDIRGEKSLRDFKDVTGLAKSWVSARRMLGKDKVAIPSESSTDGEWEEFYNAGGRPKTAADYNLKRPETLPEEYYDKELVSKAQELFHKIGLNKKQAEALFAFNNENAMAALKNHTTGQEMAMRELEDGLHKEWGKAYEQKVHLGNVAIEQGTAGNDELKERLTQKFGNDPDFIRFAATLGGKFAEHGVKGSLIPTPADIDVKIHELMMQDAYTNKNHPGHKAAVEAVQKLFVSKNAQGQV